MPEPLTGLLAMTVGYGGLLYSLLSIPGETMTHSTMVGYANTLHATRCDVWDTRGWMMCDVEWIDGAPYVVIGDVNNAVCTLKSLNRLELLGIRVKLNKGRL